MGRQLERYRNKNYHYGLQVFFIAFITACALIIPFIIFDGGVFYYYGDFNEGTIITDSKIDFNCDGLDIIY